MADSLDPKQHGQTQNIMDEPASTASIGGGSRSSTTNALQANAGGGGEVHSEALKDKVDGAVASGPKKADQSTGGRVMVGETGDLNDLAAKRQV